MEPFKIPGFPAVVYNLGEYKDFLEPFCDILLEGNGERFTLGPDGEKDKFDIWEVNDFNVTMVAAAFDDAVLAFADEVHPLFKGKGKNYFLEKDAWLNSPTSWQGTRIHRHWEPFLKASDIGDIVTVFYPEVPTGLSVDNGALHFYAEAEQGHLDHVWLPEDLESKFHYVPEKYDLIVFTTDTWHRARPFRGRRFSLATDVKLIKG